MRSRVEQRIEPVLAAHRGDTDEPERLVRLKTVFDSAAELGEQECFDGLWDGAVRIMHDRKGTLTIFWRSDEDFVDFARFIKAAWNAQDEYMPIQHITPANMTFDVAIRKLRDAVDLMASA